VIITGETGTGKELVAGADQHYNSSRAGGPFCARQLRGAARAAPRERALRPSEKGSFTGADRTRIEQVEHANGGTIFLDEIADMSLFNAGQGAAVIQEKEFERLARTRR